MSESRAEQDYAQALAAADAEGATPVEKVEMLVEMSVSLQRAPETPRELEHAVELCEHALRLCPVEEVLLLARVRVHKANALRGLPGAGVEPLLLARAELEAALPCLGSAGGSAEEVAMAEMLLGVVLQALAGARAAKITDAIAAYQRATRVFDRERHPRDFAILQNNLATAYLSIPATDERAKMREALAVQAFSEALKVVSLVDDPVEFAMLQNNLGNALQYAASGHPVENGLRALEAYDEALKVRNARRTPLQYANTISNKANCLRNLPDPEMDADGCVLPHVPQVPNRRRLSEALELYSEAIDLFRRHGALEQAELVEQARSEILVEIDEIQARRAVTDFGESRV